MKKILFLFAGLITMMTGCNSNTYSDNRKAEDKLIANYIARNGLNILTELPDDDYVWGKKDYYKAEEYDNLYFHLIKRGAAKTIVDGDTIDNTITSGETVIVRYKQYLLTENADTTDYWTTLDSPYPVEFTYTHPAYVSSSSTTTACKGWYVATMLMKYPNSECEIICPSKQGFDQTSIKAIPYGYRLSIKVKK